MRASVLFLLFVANPAASQTRDSTWAAYGGDAGGTRFSPLAQIDAANVTSLRLAWIARTGDYLTDRGRFEATPILVDGTLFVSTPLGSVLALDPATGAPFPFLSIIPARGDARRRFAPRSSYGTAASCSKAAGHSTVPAPPTDIRKRPSCFGGLPSHLRRHSLAA